jgi:hypothetical protein
MSRCLDWPVLGSPVLRDNVIVRGGLLTGPINGVGILTITGLLKRFHMGIGFRHRVGILTITGLVKRFHMGIGFRHRVGILTITGLLKRFHMGIGFRHRIGILTIPGLLNARYRPSLWRRMRSDMAGCVTEWSD